MKTAVKKALALLLALIMASATMTVSFAASDNMEDGLYLFSMEIDYKTNQLGWIAFAVEGYSIYNEEVFDCTMYDSTGVPVFDRTMYDAETFRWDSLFERDIMPAEAPEPGLEYVLMSLSVNQTVTLNPDEVYTLKIVAGSFSSAQGDISPEFTREINPSDYIYVPTVWDRILGFLNSNFIFRIIFAPLIVIIEYLYYAISGGPDMPFVLS